MRDVVSIVIVLMVSGGTAGLAQHWPHWRGPTHNGVSTETRLPDTWSAECAPTTPVQPTSAEGGPSASDDRLPRSGRSDRAAAISRGGRWFPRCARIFENPKHLGKLPLPAYSGSTPSSGATPSS